ncbi:DJ-1/PfpI family protein [Gallaecimonas sp. GXIMD1310]|uniref:DJ-1/PfpI family protein n=1 Tax=Gallaecimonas sp. GXIMD1310 TaxID=3131926 RepID=UPI00324517E6
MSDVWILCTHGCEATEVVAVADLLRRANLKCRLVSMEDSQTLQCARKIIIKADLSWQEATTMPRAMVLPGGMEGTERLLESSVLDKWVEQLQAEEGWLAASGVAPALILASKPWLPEHTRLTSHPGFHPQLPIAGRQDNALVVTDHLQRVISSQGPGTGMLLALAIIEVLAGDEMAQRIAAPLVLT